MTVREIVHAYLKDKGYGGLYNDDETSCSCRLSNLIPYDCHCLQNCQPGFIKYTGPGGWQFTITAKQERHADGENSEDV